MLPFWRVRSFSKEQKLQTYQCNVVGGQSQGCLLQGSNVYFGSKLILTNRSRAVPPVPSIGHHAPVRGGFGVDISARIGARR